MITMPEKISSDLEENIKLFTDIFANDGTIICHRFRPVKTGETPLKCALFCVDGMVSSTMINENIIRPVVMLSHMVKLPSDPITYVEQRVLQINETKQEDKLSELLHCMLYGDTIFLCHGSAKAIVIGTKGFMTRGISEPGGESYLKGPREGFTEPLLHNLAMLRRKLRTKDLKIEYFNIGTNTKTTCSLCYVDTAVDRRVLAELRKRLAKIKIDGIFDSNYIVEMVRDKRWSPFRTTGSTERPDVLASKLLEGRVGIMVDGSPIAVTVPHIFLEHFQSGEDYYVDFQFAAGNRLLRIVGFFLAVSVAPFYVALINYQQELLPLPLLLTIASARQGVPLPTFLEALVMLLAFELLREAGSRTPASIGQTLSVVGGLVVGQSAVEARLISAPMLIVVALSGICGLIVPKLKAAVSEARLGLLVLSTMLGLYGCIVGMLWLIIHIAKMRSFGIPMLSSLPFADRGSPEDSYVRSPIWLMKKYGRFLSRQSGGE